MFKKYVLQHSFTAGPGRFIRERGSIEVGNLCVGADVVETLTGLCLCGLRRTKTQKTKIITQKISTVLFFDKNSLEFLFF